MVVISHALIAQFTVMTRIQRRTGILFVHATDMEDGMSGGTWVHGDFTHQSYRTAFGPVNPRFWIDAPETERRHQVLEVPYAEIGIAERGKTAAIAFAASE